MMKYMISKAMITAWLRKLVKHGMLVAPARLSGGDVIFKEQLTPDDIMLDYKQPLYSVKSYFLPQEETLFTFKDRSPDTLQEVFNQFPRVFFGLRPCDLRAVIQADRFFSENYQDFYYYQRRKQTLLIVVGCNHPEPHCFCQIMGLGPFCSQGADVFLTDLGAGFLVDPLSPAGKAAVEDYRYFFEEATPGNLAEAEQLELRALQQLYASIPPPFPLPNFPAINDSFWDELSKSCLSCGSCSFICPLCFCYNVVDREKDREGKRVRTWDSCIFEGFTRMAGRHNLLKNRAQRLKKRFAHKLEQYPQTYGIPGCTGCGRCSVTCLGNIGMLAVLKKLGTEVAKNDGRQSRAQSEK